MRLAEAFEIDGEHIERGIRYVIVGTKNEQSLRRVPLPASVLPHLPKSIKGSCSRMASTPTRRTRPASGSIGSWMHAELLTRAKSSTRLGIVRKIGCVRPDAPKIFGGRC